MDLMCSCMHIVSLLSGASYPSNLSSNHPSINPFSDHSIPKEMIGPTGWVSGVDGLLFWVPQDCRNGLTSPAIMTIPTTGPMRCVRIDFTHFQYGTSWTKVYMN